MISRISFGTEVSKAYLHVLFGLTPAEVTFYRDANSWMNMVLLRGRHQNPKSPKPQPGDTPNVRLRVDMADIKTPNHVVEILRIPRLTPSMLPPAILRLHVQFCPSLPAYQSTGRGSDIVLRPNQRYGLQLSSADGGTLGYLVFAVEPDSIEVPNWPGTETLLQFTNEESTPPTPPQTVHSQAPSSETVAQSVN